MLLEADNPLYVSTSTDLDIGIEEVITLVIKVLTSIYTVGIQYSYRRVSLLGTRNEYCISLSATTQEKVC